MTNMLIVNLTLADLVVLFLCIPVTVTTDFWYQEWKFGLVMCHITSFIQGVSLSVSVLTLTTISLDRYMIICKPIKFRSVLTRSHVKLKLSLIWIISCLVMSPLLFVFRYEEHSIELFHDNDPVYLMIIRKCFESWSSITLKLAFELFLVLILFVIPMLVMAYAFFKISSALWPSECNSTANPSNTTVYSIAREESISTILNESSQGMLSRFVSRIDRLRANTPNQHKKLAVNSLIYQLKVCGNQRGRQSIRTKSAIHKLIEGRRKVVKLLIVLIVVFLLCWLPYRCVSLFIDFLLYIDAKNKSNKMTNSELARTITDYVYPTTLCLALLNSSANCVVYMAFTPGVFTMLKSACTKTDRGLPARVTV